MYYHPLYVIYELTSNAPINVEPRVEGGGEMGWKKSNSPVSDQPFLSKDTSQGLKNVSN